MFISKLADRLIRWRLAILLVFVALTAAAVWPALSLGFDRSVEGLFDRNDPNLKNYLQGRQLFGAAETALVAFSDDAILTVAGLKALEQFDESLSKIPGIDGVLSLADAKLPGAPVNVKSLRTHLEEGTVTPEELKIALSESPLYRGQFLSQDGRTTMLLVTFAEVGSAKTTRAEAIQNLRDACDAHDPPAKLFGGPVLVEDIYRNLEEDGRMLGLASSLILTVVIALVFRNLRWILLPLAVVHITLLWTKAILAISKMQLSMVSSPLTALVTVIGVATVVHLTIRFREERLHHEPIEATRRTLRFMMPAIFWTCLTTAAGFCSLLASRVVPVAGFGTMMAIGSSLVFITAIGLLPAAVLIGAKHTDPAHAPGEGKVSAALEGMIRGVGRRPGTVGIIALLFLGVIGSGIARLEVASSFTEDFRDSNPVVVSYRFIADRMGVTTMFDVLVDVPVADDEVAFAGALQSMRAAQKEIAQSPGVRGSLSVVNVLDFVLGPEEGFQDPASKWLSDLLRTMSPAKQLSRLAFLQGAVVSKFWNRKQNVMRVLVQMGDVINSAQRRQILVDVEAITKKHFPSARVAGVEVLIANMVSSLLKDQWVTFALAVGAILVMMFIAFRDWRLALIAMVPNAAPILLVVGAMGWLGLKVNIATAMLASVSMGLAVDFSIHYLYRFRHEVKAGKSVDQALRDAHGSTGLAMVVADLALIAGFSSLTISAFIPTIHFGILVSLAMLGGLVGNLIALPLLIRLVWRDRSAPGAG
ncbi:MAG: MMPL family transporter, partial [Phycisphaeraceae bacterium]